MGKNEILQKEMLIGAAFGTPTFGLLGSRPPPLTPPLRRTRGGGGFGKDKAGPGQGPGRQRTRGWGIGGAPGWPPHDQALGGAAGGGGQDCQWQRGGGGGCTHSPVGHPEVPVVAGGGGGSEGALLAQRVGRGGAPRQRAPVPSSAGARDTPGAGASVWVAACAPPAHRA